MEFCYECQNLTDNIPGPLCSLCDERKCNMHGGNGWTCRSCGKTDLCADCHGFSVCCHGFINGQFVRKCPGSK